MYKTGNSYKEHEVFDNNEEDEKDNEPNRIACMNCPRHRQTAV